jgi:hypothetical protein
VVIHTNKHNSILKDEGFNLGSQTILIRCPAYLGLLLPFITQATEIHSLLGGANGARQQGSLSSFEGASFIFWLKIGPYFFAFSFFLKEKKQQKQAAESFKEGEKQSNRLL